MPGAEAGTIVLDASVAVRWLVDETGSETARALLNERRQWLAPHLILTEVASALRRKVVEGLMSAALATKALDILLILVRDGGLRLERDHSLVARALTLAIELPHKVPDCLYLVLALSEQAPLATADRQLARMAVDRGVTVIAIASLARDSDG